MPRYQETRSCQGSQEFPARLACPGFQDWPSYHRGRLIFALLETHLLEKDLAALGSIENHANYRPWVGTSTETLDYMYDPLWHRLKEARDVGLGLVDVVSTALEGIKLSVFEVLSSQDI